MTPEQINELVRQITTGVVWAQWPSYLLAAAIALVVLYLHRRLDGYSKKVGEIDATTANFAELLRQSKESAGAGELGKQAAITAQFEILTGELKANTETVEKVKVEIAHGDWAVREWKTVRRVKLELLLENVYKDEEWRSTFSSQRIYKGKVDPGGSPIPQIKIIGLLYFPELSVVVREFCEAHDAFVLLTLQHGSELIAPDADALAALGSGRFADAKDSFAVADEIRQKFIAGNTLIAQRLYWAQQQFNVEARAVFIEGAGHTEGR